jgi:TonB family protein
VIRSTFAYAVLAAALTAQPLAAADEPPVPSVLEPTSPWNLRYDDEACRLVRTFGTGEAAVAVLFSKYAPGPEMEVLVTGKSLTPRNSIPTYRFLPGGDRIEARTALYGTSEAGLTTWQFSSRILAPERVNDWRHPVPAHETQTAEHLRAAEIDSFELSAGPKLAVVLKIGKLDKPFAALDTCLVDLVSTWGYDPGRQRAIASLPRPKTNPGGWLGFDAYPPDLVLTGKSGKVRIRLDVGTEGRPTKCFVQGATSDPAFEDVSCKALMRRARFEPARDASGQAVPYYWATAVSFVTYSGG